MSEDVLTTLVDAVHRRDVDKIKQIVEEYIPAKHFIPISCKNCGEVVAFEENRSLLTSALAQSDARVKYLVLAHMLTDPKHNVVIPMSGGFEFPISHTLEKQFKEACARFDKDYNVELPGIVERWRLKCSGQR
jgi:hypothetical protein